MNKTAFIKSPESALSLRLDFIIALAPSLIWAYVRFGISAAATFAVSILSAVISEILIELLLNRKFKAPSLYSVYCSMIFGAMMYSQTDFILTALGSVLCITLIRLMGGVGKSFVFAPIAARIIIFKLLPYRINKPELPLEVLYSGELPAQSTYDLVVGMSESAIGTVSAMALITAIVYLWMRKSGDFKASLTYIVVLMGLTFAFPAFQGRGVESAIYEFLAGECLFIAAFVLPDYASSPNSAVWKCIQGCICALITFALRKAGYVADSAFMAVFVTNIITFAATGIVNHKRDTKYVETSKKEQKQ